MGGIFEIDNKKSRVKEINEELIKEDAYKDLDRASKLNLELSNLEKVIKNYESTLEEVKSDIELLEILNEKELIELQKSIKTLEESYNEIKISSLLNGEYDSYNCYLEIHPGAGGTESCDWASMLLRMYQMFFDKNDYKYKVIEKQNGDEAGIKSVTLLVSGYYPYGYLKSERGVHRLVRISPFDSNARRHTSFASVSVTPEITSNINIEIKDTDLKVDVFHSSGAGGQSVNTSNSAVRITHIPSKIVVSCQVERSQVQNKEICMQMLKSKLYALEKEKEDAKVKSLKGENIDINFGSQIRNYVLEPYKLVKDLRTGYETTNASKVLDGDIKPFMESFLEKKGD